MRRAAAVGVSVLLVGVGAAGGYAARALTEDDDDPGITEAEHDRLVQACVESPDGDGPACASFVAGLVDYVDELGCGYREAAELLDLEMRYPDSGESEAFEDMIDDVLDRC